MEEVLVPLYLHHRYQVEAAASAIGGMHYIYALRGDGRVPVQAVSGTEQRAALTAVLATIKPTELRLPETVVRQLPPRPMGWGDTRELFPRYTGDMFDIITPAVVATDLALSNVLDAERAARVVEQHAVDATVPSLDDVIDAVLSATFEVATVDAYEREIKRATERVAVDALIRLAANARMPQVRAVASARLQRLQGQLARSGTDLQSKANSEQNEGDSAHRALLARDIDRALNRPAAPYAAVTLPAVPPGAPIGEPALEFLKWWDPLCAWR
jgi:hypothetical protein